MAEPSTKEAAEIVWIKAQTIRQLADAGYDRPSVVDAVASGDLTKLKPNPR